MYMCMCMYTSNARAQYCLNALILLPLFVLSCLILSVFSQQIRLANAIDPDEESLTSQVYY